MRLTHYHRAINVYAVNLKNRLRDIEIDRANLAHGRYPSSGSFHATILWHLDAAEWAPSTASQAEDVRLSNVKIGQQRLSRQGAQE